MLIFIAHETFSLINVLLRNGVFLCNFCIFFNKSKWIINQSINHSINQSINQSPNFCMVDWESLIYSSQLFQMVLFLKCRVVMFDSSWKGWWKRRDRKKIYIYMFAFSRHFYPKWLTVHSGYKCFCQYVCSLGIDPTTFALLTRYHWATDTIKKGWVHSSQWIVCWIIFDLIM